MRAAGEVVSVRINPKDCMAVVDFIDKLGVYTQGMSFSSAVAIAFASSMESFRDNGILPQRSGFEYTGMMQRFALKSRTPRKLQIAATFKTTAAQFGVRPLVPQTPEARHEQEQRRIRWQELKFQMENNALNFSPANSEEFIALDKEFSQQEQP